jgi:NADH-quinone oxidoreductase subunit A
MLESFGPVLLFLAVAIVFGVAPLIISRLVHPRRPDAVKLSPYECGVEPIGPAHIQFNSRFYLYALIFAIFDVEAIFIFPWAVAYGVLSAEQLGLFVLVEMVIFVGILLVGFAYAWRKRALDWQ